MPNSPTNHQTNPQNPQNPNTQKRLCDFCTESVALIYCRADSAKLCLSCDREVHSTNQLFTKHTRFQLCDACDSSPASIFCHTENSVLCQNCDYERHSRHGSSLNHDRRPLEGFTGCPCVSDLSVAIGFEGFDSKSLVLGGEIDVNNKGFNGGLFDGLNEENDGFSDLFVWDVPTMVSLDDLIVSTDKSHNFQAMVVPPLPKDRNLSCGQHKHEILHQLRELAKSEPGIKQDVNPLVMHHFVADEDKKDSMVKHKIQAYQHDEEHSKLQGNEASPYNWCNDTGEDFNDMFFSPTLSGSHIEDSVPNSDTPSGLCSSANPSTKGCNSQNPIRNESLGFPQNVSREVISADRDSALSRYKEKKRTRRFEKHIRYESRKLQAENRIRIKGRFAKVDNRKNQT
uniref:BBX transcription factor n=1 Tax=Oxybasis rubra TaxID=3560 RepID=A0A9E6MSS6_OXYRB|nr:BBX transcription factor [Oxybasis rubra]